VTGVSGRREKTSREKNHDFLAARLPESLWKGKAIIASKPTQTTNLTGQNKHEKNNYYS
jgi:hypothetical protein